MNVLEKYSDKQLEEELRKRNTPPEQIEDVDLTKLRTQAKNYLDFLYENNCEPKDTSYLMYEEVMKTFYGPDIFKWIIQRIP